MKRSITAFCSSFLLAVLSFAALTSCSDDDLAVPLIGGGDGSTTVVKFILNGNAPGSENAPGTYVLGKIDEDAVSEVDILLFTINNKLENALPIVGTVRTDGSGLIHVEANILVKYYGSIVFIANAHSILSTITLTEGMQYTEVMPLLELTLDEKWNTTKGSQGYMPIPMHGETGFVKIKADVTNTFNIGLTRMLNSVDVALTTDAAKGAFELTSVAVYHRNTVGRLLQPKIAGVPNLPADVGKIKGPLRYTDKEITTENISSVGEIYLMESHIVVEKTDGLERVADATCLVVGGKYIPDGKTYYYRIDFALKDKDPTGFPLHFYNILRNHNYNVNITAVNGPGEDNEEDALNTERSLIDVEVIGWDIGGAIDGAIDGQHILRLSKGSFDLPPDAQTATSTQNKLTVASTHPEGWYIEKITEVVGGNEIEIPEVDRWLKTDLSSPGTAQMSAKTFSLILAENSLLVPRTGYIYIKSGPRMVFKLKVTQGKGLIKVEKVDWVDYLGSDFKTITIENTLGESFTSEVDVEGKLSSLIKTEDIAVIKVTYIGNEITITSTDKYSYDAKVKTLTITDGRLIGLPKHLDKMRNELGEHYIQVADVDLTDFENFEKVTGNWLPVGTLNTPFTGSYDGGSGNGGTGFKIYSLNINRPNTDYIGLFGDVFGALKNIHIASGNITGKILVGGIGGRMNVGTSAVGCTNAANISGSSSVGGIIGYTRGNISYCENTGAITGEGVGAENIGGICGETFYIKIEKCKNTGKILANDATSNKNIGGICGISRYSEIWHSINTGDVSGTSNVGGICGELYAVENTTALISNCTNSGVIDATGTQSTRIGGICGDNSDVGKITNSTNSGEVKGLQSEIESQYIAGICGHNANGEISGCTNKAPITGVRNYVGGISGDNNKGATIINCHNLSGAYIKGRDYVGGISGNNGSFGTSAGQISKSTNEAEVIGTGNYIGGITGHIYGGPVIACINSATISGKNHVGGIIGGGNPSGTSACYNIGLVSGDTYVGVIFGYPTTTAPALENCYYGGAAKDIATTFGAKQFGEPPAWPHSGLNNWSYGPVGYWSDLGNWNSGIGTEWPKLVGQQ